MKLKKYILFLTLPIFSLLFFSCNNDDDPDSPYVGTDKKTTILIYAVASNNLESNLYSDKNEILACAPQLDLASNSVLIYQVDNKHYNPELLRLTVNENGEYSYETLKEYDPYFSSLSKSRFTEVFEDLSVYSPSERYGLVLWSHGTGVDYSDEIRYRSENLNTVMPASFGYDKNPYTENIYQVNIDHLASAIPDNLFDFIWFDACYMSGIETIYELRNKCKYFVGYPTEVFEWGLPYDMVMPHMINLDLIEGAKEFFNYYSNHTNSLAQVATIAVIDMSKIDIIAELSKQAFENGAVVNTSSLQKYSRSSVGPFYDFNGYAKLMAKNKDDYESWEMDWNKTMDEFILYKAATPVDFNYRPIDLEQFSGISTHIYNANASDDMEIFYRSLSWFKEVYGN